MSLRTGLKENTKNFIELKKLEIWYFVLTTCFITIYEV